MLHLPTDQITFDVVKEACQNISLDGSVSTNTVCLDYDRDKNNIPKFVSAFANTHGGILVIAIQEKDDDGILQIKGMSPNIIGNRQTAIAEGISPPLHPEVIPIHIHEDSDEVIYVVRVPQSRLAPHTIGEDCYIWTENQIKVSDVVKANRQRFVRRRHKHAKETLSTIVTRIEERSNWLFETDASDNDKDDPQLTVIARPVFADTPIISQQQLWDTYKSWNYAKLVAGGIAHFGDPPCFNHNEANEYGLVYYRKRISYVAQTSGNNSERHISVFDFINGIDELFDWAKRLYKACDAAILIEVTAQLENVFRKKMLRNFDPAYSSRLVYSLPNENVCYDTSVFAKTPKYLSTQLLSGEQQQKIYETLTLQLIQPFNIPQHQVIKHVKKIVESKVDKYLISNNNSSKTV